MFFGSTPCEKLKKIYSNYLTDICVFHICIFYRLDFFTEQNLKDTQKKIFRTESLFTNGLKNQRRLKFNKKLDYEL